MTGEAAPAAATALLLIAAMALSLALSATQAFIGARVGTDHPVHAFIVRNIRDNAFRLFVRIPRLLNSCYCGALPLYMHWIVAHFPARATFWCERLLNPAVNTLHVGIFALLALLAAREAQLPTLYVAVATLAFALTPQFYHALSARNFGLSSRGTGLLLLTLFFLAAYLAGAGVTPALSWPALVLCGWLIWGFNTFAQQALCIVSVLLLLIGRRYVPLAGAALGLVLFIALHPHYALGYLRHTLRFIRTYAREIAAIYILASRPSIWRDLVWDVWRKGRCGALEAARYAYGNSVLIVVLLNPLAIVACYAALRGALPAGGLLAYAGQLSVAGALAMLLTSLRATRFLGEPERYIEATTPWAVLCAVGVLSSHGAWRSLVGLTVLFLLLDLAQLLASKLLLRRLGTQTAQLGEVETALRARLAGSVRFCSNNEGLTKLLMQNDWQYAYLLAAGEDYGGMKFQEVFSVFPLVKRAACERIVSTYRVNACLLDRAVFDELFTVRPPGLRSMSIAYESPRLRLVILDWAEA